MMHAAPRIRTALGWMFLAVLLALGCSETTPEPTSTPVGGGGSGPAGGMGGTPIADGAGGTGAAGAASSAGCTTAADCADKVCLGGERCTVCSDGTCDVCHTDADCVPVPPDGCAPDHAYADCRNLVCESKCAACISDAECAGAAAGSTCGVTTHVCGCSGAEDCTGNESGSVCVQGACGCFWSEDCPDGKVCPGSEPYYNGGICSDAECTTSADCAGRMCAWNAEIPCEFCSEGRCGQCETATDCANVASSTSPLAGSAGACREGICLGCLTNEDCLENPLSTGATCDANACFCESNDDCAHTQRGALCDGGICGCVTNDDCSEGRTCADSSGLGLFSCE